MNTATTLASTEAKYRSQDRCRLEESTHSVRVKKNP